MSECQTDCQRERGKVLNQTLNSDGLVLQLGHWMNCATSAKDDIAAYEYENGVLNIVLKPKPIDVQLEENGDTTLKYAMSFMCDCYFILDFKLSGIKAIPDSVLINGESTNNYSGLMIGLEENLGVIDHGKLEIKDFKGKTKKNLRYSINRIMDYKIESFDEYIHWNLIDSSGTDTLITFKYANTSIPQSFCYQNRCDSLVEVLLIGEDTVYKFMGLEKGVSDSEGTWYVSPKYGILGTFGYRGPSYFYTEKNKELVSELQKKGLSF